MFGRCTQINIAVVLHSLVMSWLSVKDTSKVKNIRKALAYAASAYFYACFRITECQEPFADCR